MKPYVSTKHLFTLNPDSPSVESVSLVTEIEDGKIVLQTLVLDCYGNYSGIGISGGMLSPEVLRRLADELEAKLNELQV